MRRFLIIKRARRALSLIISAILFSITLASQMYSVRAESLYPKEETIYIDEINYFLINQAPVDEQEEQKYTGMPKIENFYINKDNIKKGESEYITDVTQSEQGNETEQSNETEQGNETDQSIETGQSNETEQGTEPESTNSTSELKPKDKTVVTKRTVIYYNELDIGSTVLLIVAIVLVIVGALILFLKLKGSRNKGDKNHE